MMERQHFENTLLRWQCTSDSASDGWYIRRGNYITLAEMSFFGSCTVSAFDLHRAYVSFPVFIFKKHHSVSHTAEAQKRRNAKSSKFSETGKQGMPRPSRRSR